MIVMRGVTSQTGDISEINPFRYRGYYYDNETGFYYLQTRYYDPTICRFINADNYELVMQLGQGFVGGFNVYSYCFNNPIMFIDDGGYWPKSFNYNGWNIRFDPPRAGKGQQYHVHVDGYGESFAQNFDGTPHDGLTSVPNKKVRRVIEKATKGKWVWKINKMMMGDLPQWQEGFSTTSLPYNQESFSVVSLPQFHEQFSMSESALWQDGFSMPSIEKNNVLIYVLGGTTVVVVFGVVVYLTGGCALILLA
jgi:RHS repeat-associated protein